MDFYISEGKKYKTRSGHEVTILKKIRARMMWLGLVDFGSYEEPATFDDGGRFFFSGEKSSIDLVEEVKNEQ